MEFEKYIMHVNEFGGIDQGTLVRRVDENNKETGPYIVVWCTDVLGVAGEPESVKAVYGLEIDLQTEEPRVLAEDVTLMPNERINVIGTFAINTEDPHWPNAAKRIREYLCLDGDCD